MERRQAQALDRHITGEGQEAPGIDEDETSDFDEDEADDFDEDEDEEETDPDAA